MAERLQSRILSGMDSADAWNEVSVDLLRCAKVNQRLQTYLNLKVHCQGCARIQIFIRGLVQEARWSEPAFKMFNREKFRLKH